MTVADPEAAEDRFGFGNADPFAPPVYSPADLLVVLGVITFTSLAIGFPGQLTLTEARSRRSGRKRKSRWNGAAADAMGCAIGCVENTQTFALLWN